MMFTTKQIILALVIAAILFVIYKVIYNIGYTKGFEDGYETGGFLASISGEANKLSKSFQKLKESLDSAFNEESDEDD